MVLSRLSARITNNRLRTPTCRLLHYMSANASYCGWSGPEYGPDPMYGNRIPTAPHISMILGPTLGYLEPQRKERQFLQPIPVLILPQHRLPTKHFVAFYISLCHAQPVFKNPWMFSYQASDYIAALSKTGAEALLLRPLRRLRALHAPSGRGFVVAMLEPQVMLECSFSFSRPCLR